MSIASIQNFRRIFLTSHKIKNCKLFLDPLVREFKTVSKSIPPTESNEEIREIVREVPDDFRNVYPDFLPPSKFLLRNSLREKIEREDMLARRNIIDVPEFHVGSIMRVTLSDNNATGKVNKFTGICIQRDSFGIRSCFTLRNIVDHIGVEIQYDIYCPLILDIETLRLEKRLDPHLLYLRDCLPEYSTFPMDMESEPIAIGVPVPLNETKVELKPRPWSIRWHIKEFNGIEGRKYSLKEIAEYHVNRRPWEKYDLMLDYREGITMEEQAKVFKEISPHFAKLEESRRKIRRIREDNQS